MVQWIEPLFLAVFGASDSEAVCDQGEFVEGSFRTMSSGWGIPGTTDVRTFGDVGTGRFSHTGFDWLLEMITPSSSGILGCESEGMGADIRTISSSSPRDLPTCQCPVEDGDDDESSLSRPSDLPSMNVGEGIEIRVFDNFPAENMKTVYRVVALVAEASRVHHAAEYIYDSLSWRNAAQAAMREGWNAILGAEYVADLERNLNVDLSLLQGNTQAFQVFRELSDQLFNTHKNGLWTVLFLDDVESGMAIGNPNRASWVSENSYPPKSLSWFVRCCFRALPSFSCPNYSSKDPLSCLFGPNEHLLSPPFLTLPVRLARSLSANQINKI